MSYPNYYNQQLGYLNQPVPQFNMPQPMQPQFQTNNNFLGGKIVDSLDVVRVTDIPIDGSNYYFPKADGSEIYVKKWLGNGTTEVSTYKRVENIPDEQKQEIDFAAMEGNIIDRLNSIDERISNIENKITPTKSVAKKEA